MNFKTNPAVRAAVRSVVVAVLTYLVGGFTTGFGDWKSVAYGVGAAAAYALLGVLTPIEPKVGIKTEVSG